VLAINDVRLDTQVEVQFGRGGLDDGGQRASQFACSSLHVPIGRQYQDITQGWLLHVFPALLCAD
jgi:hypothetical protein